MFTVFSVELVSDNIAILPEGRRMKNMYCGESVLWPLAGLCFPERRKGFKKESFDIFVQCAE
jgi:hypothetical protein